jgi:hypothetical protein
MCGRGLNSKGSRGCGKRGEGEDDPLPSRSCINGWDSNPDWTLTLTLTLTLKLVLQQLGLEVLWGWTFTFTYLEGVLSCEVFPPFVGLWHWIQLLEVFTLLEPLIRWTGVVTPSTIALSNNKPSFSEHITSSNITRHIRVICKVTFSSPRACFHPLSPLAMVSAKWENFIKSQYEMLKLSI